MGKVTGRKKFTVAMQIDWDGGAFWHAARRESRRTMMYLSACGVYASQPRGLAPSRERAVDCPSCLAVDGPIPAPMLGQGW